VAACSGAEDILKVGLSHAPIARWSAFHRRWFEAFDLDQQEAVLRVRSDVCLDSALTLQGPD